MGKVSSITTVTLVQDIREPTPPPTPRESSGWTEQARLVEADPMEGVERTEPTTDTIRPPDSIRRRTQAPPAQPSRTVMRSGTVQPGTRANPDAVSSRTGSRLVGEELPPNIGSSIQSLVSAWHSLRSAHSNIRKRHADEYESVSVEAAKKVSKPSTIRYLMYGSACVIMDVWGIVISALNLTVILIIVTFIVNVILMVFMWIFGRLLFGSRIKRMKKKREELEARTEGVKKDIQNLYTESVRFRKYAQGALRRSPQLAAKAALVTKRAAWVTRRFAPAAKAASKVVSWISKPGVSRSAEFIPFIQALPWWTIGIIAQYIVHRGEYKNAQEVLVGYQETNGDYFNMLDTHYAVQVGTIEVALASTSAVPAKA